MVLEVIEKGEDKPNDDFGLREVVEVTQLIKKCPALKNIKLCCNNSGIRRSFDR
jgi:hypothetical protein